MKSINVRYTLIICVNRIALKSGATTYNFLIKSITNYEREKNLLKKVAHIVLMECAKFAEKNGCKHEMEDMLGLKPHGILSGVLKDEYPNVEGTKLWDVLSLLYDVGRDLSMEEHVLYVKGKLAQAKKVLRRRESLRKMIDLVMNKSGIES